MKLVRTARAILSLNSRTAFIIGLLAGSVGIVDVSALPTDDAGQ